MSTLRWIIVGIVLYWMVLIALQRSGSLPPSVGTQGPIITLHTKRGREFLDWLSGPKRFWRAWGNFGIGIAFVIMFGMFLAVVSSALNAMQTPGRTTITEPRNVLVIPGVNEFLPLSVAPEILFGLIVGLVVHEGGHGLLCRVEDIDIESMGLVFFAIIPIGAFVQPDHESQQTADRGAQTRMFAAGVMNNFAVTIVAFVLLFWLVGSSIAVAPGMAVGGLIAGSSADHAGIGAGDRITAIENDSIATAVDFQTVLSTNDNRVVTVVIDDERSVTVERSLLVVAAIPGGPAGIDAGETIVTVDDAQVHTEAELVTILRDRTVVSVTTAEGTETTFPAGAYAPHVAPDGPLAGAGAPSGDDASVLITRIDGDRVISTTAMSDYLEGTEPGQLVVVEAYVGGTPHTYNVTLGAHPQGHGLLGVSMQSGITGLSVNDFGTQTYPSSAFLAVIGGETDDAGFLGLDSFFGKMFAALILPIASVFGAGIHFNFAGFTGFVTNFYVVDGPLSIFGGGVFLIANLLFWTAWINLNLGIFNCIPAFPLDGGHLLRTSTEAIVSRIPIESSYFIVKYVTVSVGVTMLAGLILMIFGQGLLT